MVGGVDLSSLPGVLVKIENRVGPFHTQELQQAAGFAFQVGHQVFELVVRTFMENISAHRSQRPITWWQSRAESSSVWKLAMLIHDYGETCYASSL